MYITNVFNNNSKILEAPPRKISTNKTNFAKVKIAPLVIINPKYLPPNSEGGPDASSDGANTISKGA